MAEQNKLKDTNHNRNRRENEDLIAAGILSLLNKGVSMDVMRWTDIARETDINPITVRRHMRDGKFFTHNYQRIAEDFAKDVRSRPSPKLFAPVIVSRISEHRVWFEIESLRKSYHLLEEITSLLREPITASWPNYSRPSALYRIICSEIATAIEHLLAVDFAEDQLSATMLSLTNLLIAVEEGRFNTSLLTLLQ